MSIVIAVLAGCIAGGFVGVSFGWLWRSEEIESLAKANAQLIEERDNAQNIFRTKQRSNWVN